MELSQIADLFKTLAKHEEAIKAINYKVNLVGIKIKHHLKSQKKIEKKKLLVEVLDVLCPKDSDGII